MKSMTGIDLQVIKLILKSTAPVLPMTLCKYCTDLIRNRHTRIKSIRHYLTKNLEYKKNENQPINENLTIWENFEN